MYKNFIIEQLNTGKQEVYKSLQAGDKVMYTTNFRAVPGHDNVFISDNVKVCINPTERQDQYFNKEVMPITRLKDIIVNRNLQGKINIDNKKHLETLQRHIQGQYLLEDIKNFLKKS